MKASEIREMSVEELELKLADLKEELFNLRFQLARIGAVKKDIARVSTILRMRELNGAEA